MSFSSGSVAFRRFAVVGETPSEITEEMLSKLSEFALKGGEGGAGEEEEYGWCGGRHILDGHFSFERNVFAECLFFALRVDTNKVPGELKKAYTLMEEEAVAAGNPSGFISKAQKKEVKETIQKQIDKDLRSGKFRRSKMVSVLWDVAGGTLYCSAGGKTLEKLQELFERTFGLTLEALSAGTNALRLLEDKGRRRDYEDLKPTRFVIGEDGESQYPDYPWTVKGDGPKDFLGNEFLMWLWYGSEKEDGSISAGAGEIDVMVDRALDLECAYGQTGKDYLRGEGVSRSPEAREAVRVGKVPRNAGFLMHVSGEQYQFNLNGETLGMASLKLPEVKEAETDRVLFEERIGFIRELGRQMDEAFGSFLKVRASAQWEGYVNGMRRWMAQPVKRGTAVVESFAAN